METGAGGVPGALAPTNTLVGSGPCAAFQYYSSKLSDPQTREIPIIGMSAHAPDSERETAIATGCDEFDAKPIAFEGLVATIRRVLANPR